MYDPHLIASVSVTTIVNTLSADLLQTGTWLNVIGYATNPAARRVEAIAAWHVGPVQRRGSMGDYEAIVKARRDALSKMKVSRDGVGS